MSSAPPQKIEFVATPDGTWTIEVIHEGWIRRYVGVMKQRIDMEQRIVLLDLSECEHVRTRSA